MQLIVKHYLDGAMTAGIPWDDFDRQPGGARESGEVTLGGEGVCQAACLMRLYRHSCGYPPYNPPSGANVIIALRIGSEDYMDKEWLTLLGQAIPIATAGVTGFIAWKLHVASQQRSDDREREARTAQAKADERKHDWERAQEAATQLRNAATTLLVTSNDYRRGLMRGMDKDERLALIRKLDEAHEQFSFLAPDELEQLSTKLFNATTEWSADEDAGQRLRAARRALGYSTRKVLHGLQPYALTPPELSSELSNLGLYTVAGLTGDPP